MKQQIYVYTYFYIDIYVVSVLRAKGPSCIYGGYIRIIFLIRYHGQVRNSSMGYHIVGSSF